jgi:hypothetical protein
MAFLLGTLNGLGFPSATDVHDVTHTLLYQFGLFFGSLSLVSLSSYVLTA